MIACAFYRFPIRQNIRGVPQVMVKCKRLIPAKFHLNRFLNNAKIAMNPIRGHTRYIKSPHFLLDMR